MSRGEALIIIILLLITASAMGKEVAYAFGESNCHILDNGNITEFNGSDLINFTVAGGLEGESPAHNLSRYLDSIRSEINLKINKLNQTVRNKGHNMVGKASGNRRVDQICLIYDQLVKNWIYVEDWKGSEEFQYSNQSLDLGEKVGSEGKGDCDDFSILLASLVESVGATSRIIFAYGQNGGHAYAEVYLGNINDQGNDINRMIDWLREKYNVNLINTHTDFESGDVWLNLDWWREPGGANHPGGPLYSAAKQTRVYPTGRESKSPLTAINQPPRIMKFNPEKLGLIPRTAGSIITFNANVSNLENDSIYFMFRLNNKNVTSWKTTSPQQTKNDSDWTWETNSSHIGSNIIEVWVRDGNHADNSGYDDKTEIRLEIKPAVPVGIWSAAPNASSFSWDPQNFGGFYYDINDDVGCERLAAKLTDGFKLSGDPPYGLVYTTRTGNKKFEFRDWGDYKVIGFMGEKYFAGYNAGKSEVSSQFSNESENNNSLASEQVERILMDEATEKIITYGSSLKLREGYELATGSLDIDGNKVYVELSKDGQIIDSRVIIPPNNIDESFYYYSDNGESKGVKTIAVHFKNSLRGADQNLATIDRIWQVSDRDPTLILNNSSRDIILTAGNPLKLEEGYELKIGRVDIDGNRVYLELSKNGQVIDSKVIIPPNNIDENFYYYSDNGESKGAKTIAVHFKNSLRGTDQNLATIDRIWQVSDRDPTLILNNSSRDIILTAGNPLKLEEGYELGIMSVDIDGNRVYLELSKDGQVIDSRVIIPPNNIDESFYYYSENGESKGVKTIAVHFKNSFRGANHNLATVDRIWQVSDRDPTSILNNSSQEMTLTSGNSLKLEEGYELAIRSIDIDGNKVYLELSKDGLVVDSRVIIPPNNADGSFYYTKDFEGEKSVKIIAVHLKNALRGADRNLATVDRIWQASDRDPTSILNNSSQEMILTSGNPLKLEEGYELAIKSIDIDGNKVYLELLREGATVDSKIVIPSGNKHSMILGKNETRYSGNYWFKMNLSGQKNLVVIGAHLKNSFRGVDQILVTIDGVWQISDVPSEVRADTQYDKMTITNVDATNGVITMSNKENPIFLMENSEYSLMPDLTLRTTDREKINKSNPINLALFKEISQAGSYDIRGRTATGNFSWFSGNFSGFFYDVDQGFGTEMIQTNLSNGNQLSGNPPYGVIYTTIAQEKNFKFRRWGTYNAIGFLGKKYFNNYLNNPETDDDDKILFAKSIDTNSLAKGQLEEILKDDNSEIALASGKTLKLAEGYELVIRSIDSDGKVSLELNKDGHSKDLMIMVPSKDGATMADKTYYYVTNVGSLKGLAIIAVHFKKALRVGGSSQAIIDGIWQISDTPCDVKANNQYEEMRIADLDPYSGTITMDNRDNTITLARNIDTPLMADIHLRTADNDTLRYYIYMAVTIGED